MIERQLLSDIEKFVAEALADGERGEVILPAAQASVLLAHIANLEGLYEDAVGDWCHVCGCCMDAPCVDDDENACGWANEERTLCTACAPKCEATADGPFGAPLVCTRCAGHEGFHYDLEANTEWSEAAVLQAALSADGGAA